MSRQTRNLVAVMAYLAAAMGAAAWARSAYGVEWSPAGLREIVDGAGLWGPLIFVLLISLRPVLFVPSQLFLISAGICFGTLEGALYAALGITLGGVLTFQLTRWVGRDAVLARMPPGLRGALDGGGRTPVLGLLFVGAAYPVGPVLWLSVGAALAGLALPSFAVTLFAGGFVRATIYAFFGSSLVDADFHEMALGAVAIGVVALLPLLHPRLRAYVWRLVRES